MKVNLDIITILLLFIAVGWMYAAPAEDLPEEAVSYEGFQIWTTQPKSDEEKEFLLKLEENYDGVEFWKAVRRNDAPMDLIVSPDFQTEVKMRLEEKKIDFKVTIENLQKAIENENPKPDNEDELENRFGHKMDWNSYHRMDDINGYLNYLADTYPKTVQLISIGSSSEGRPLNVIRISSGGSSAKPAVWIDGGIHAREWISPAVVTYVIHQLVEVPANEKLIKNVDWYILPVMNPDGYEFTHSGNRLWRKTRSTRGAKCKGADPNRNFGHKWGGKGTSKDTCSDIYHGPNAFSEPETRAVSNFIQGKANRIKLYLTVHSYGQYILIPWGYDVASKPADFNDMKSLAQKAASKFRRYQYTVGNSAELLYPAAGGSDDWAKSIGIKYAYTVELADTGSYGFVLPASQIKAVCEDFFPAMEVFADQVAITP